MPCRHGTLSNPTGETIVVESSHKQGMISGANGEVSSKKGEAIPSLIDEATIDGKSTWKTWWSAKPTKGS